MQVNCVERGCTSQRKAHHDHPGDPEEQDVMTSFEYLQAATMASGEAVHVVTRMQGY